MGSDWCFGAMSHTHLVGTFLFRMGASSSPQAPLLPGLMDTPFYSDSGSSRNVHLSLSLTATAGVNGPTPDNTL